MPIGKVKVRRDMILEKERPRKFRGRLVVLIWACTFLMLLAWSLFYISLQPF